MNKIDIGNGVFEASEISLGCMRISEMEVKEVSRLIGTAMENGIDFFDHADIYGGGRSEEVFAEAVGMCPSVREKMLLQTKCGIRRGERVGYYDFSKAYILDCVDKSLQRLRTDYIDVLLLHRPDTLMEPEEVAEAFEILHESGKVKYFGVSNMNPYQMELLGKSFGRRLLINQLQLSAAHTGMIDAGINVNTGFPGAVDRDGGILEYCRLKDVTIQAWSPFQYGFFEGVFLNSDKFPELNRKIDEIAARKGVTNSAIAVAWILRHPAKIQPVVGTTNAARLADICKASEAALSREEWYEIYLAAGNKLP